MSFKLSEEKMNHITILLEKNEKSKTFLNILINSISIETIIFEACISAVDIEGFRCFDDEISNLYVKYQLYSKS